MKRSRSTGWAIITICIWFVLAAQSARADVTYYGGGWSNTSAGGTSGNAFAQLIDNGTQVQLNLDVQGAPYFGGFSSGPASILELVGTRSADQSIAFNPITGHPTYGDVTAAISSTGAVSIQCYYMPFGGVTAHGPLNGSISPNDFELNYFLVADTGGIITFMGSIDMRSVPEPALLTPVVVALAIARRRRCRAREAT